MILVIRAGLDCLSFREIIVSEVLTDIPPGLKFLPYMEHYCDTEDWAPFTQTHSVEVSDNNYSLVRRISPHFMTHGVVEIGVSRNGDRSFTHALFSNKPDNIKYLGIDVEDKSHLNNPEKNIYTIRSTSYDQTRIREYMKDIGLEKISILLIDGHHSLHAVRNDWLYADLLSDDGIVIFHDTNSHPGPLVLTNSIDPSKYRIERFFETEDDYGMVVAYKI